VRDGTRQALDAAKRHVEAGRLDDALERANNLLHTLSGQEHEEAREEWSAFLWAQPGDFKDFLK
jgi:thioredoxin-like negative regulator of GroEL